MFRLLIKKEFISCIRDVRLLVSAAIILSLTIVAIVLGKQSQDLLAAQREEAQTEMQESWLNQDDKHPHSAAHYGQFAFKPKSVLSFLDAGLDSFTGTSVFMEAHKRHDILFSAAQDSTGTTRFGELSLALIFQVLMPLLIIFLTFNSFTREREEATLKLINAQGLSSAKLVQAKVWGIFLVVMAIFLPAMLLAYLFLDDHSSGLDPWALSKLLSMTAVYALYFLVVTLIGVLISAFAKNSTSSLLTSLSLWILACVILPKTISNLADKVYPVQSQFEFHKSLNDKVSNGIDGHNPSDARLAQLKQEVLQTYNVSSIQELPVNWSGIAMQAGEEYTDLVYDQEFSNVERQFNKQNQLSVWTGFINPFLAIRNVSMSLAGTDFQHHLTFARAAEDYRRDFVKKLNKDMEVNHKPGISYTDYNVGREMWETIDRFEYQLPSTATILKSQWPGLLALVGWILIGFSIIKGYSTRIRII